MTDSLDDLLEQLRSSELHTYIEAASRIPQFGSEAVPPLLEMLADESREHIWWLIAQALGRIGDKGAVEPLIAILKRPQTTPWLTRKYTAWALGDLGDPRAVDVLIDMLHDRDWEEDEDGDDELYQTDEPDSENIEAAAGALTQIGEWKGSQAIIERLLDNDDDWWFNHRMGEWGGEAAFQYLLTALASQDSTRRDNAGSLLGEFGDKRAIEPLRVLADTDPDEHVMHIATRVLSKLNKHNELTNVLFAIDEVFPDPHYVATFGIAKPQATFHSSVLGRVAPYHLARIHALLRPDDASADQAIQREQMIVQTKSVIREAIIVKILDRMLQYSVTTQGTLEFISVFYPFLPADLLDQQIAPTLRKLAQDAHTEAIRALAQAALAALEKRVS